MNEHIISIKLLTMFLKVLKRGFNYC